MAASRRPSAIDATSWMTASSSSQGFGCAARGRLSTHNATTAATPMSPYKNNAALIRRRLMKTLYPSSPRTLQVLCNRAFKWFQRRWPSPERQPAGKASQKTTNDESPSHPGHWRLGTVRGTERFIRGRGRRRNTPRRQRMMKAQMLSCIRGCRGPLRTTPCMDPMSPRFAALLARGSR